MVKKLLFFLFFLLSITTAHAQYENVWAFGPGAGVDFNSGSPVAITTNITGDEGTASICNSSGQLLFYTEGTTVWDRNGNVMPNGTELVPNADAFTAVNGESPTGSTSQSSLIVPMINDKNKYYVFSLTSGDCLAAPYFDVPFLLDGQLYYSVLDMSLNNGLGDIVTGEKGIFVDSDLAENVTAVVGDKCDIWVVAGTIEQNIKAWEITEAGLNMTPVFSTGVGSSLNITNYLPQGCIAASPNRKKLAVATFGIAFNAYPSASGAALYDFDPATGIASNGLSLYAWRDDTVIDIGYGICFSPDNSKLYVQDVELPGVGYIKQFDLSSGDPAVIPTTSVTVGQCDYLSDLKLAPDGKIYFVSSTNLGSIDNPNAAGVGSNFFPASLTLKAIPVYGGLPNVVPVFIHDTVYHDTTIQANCVLQTIKLNASDTSGRDYYWSNEGNSPSIIVDTPGTYWVQYYTAPCTSHADTFVVKPWKTFTLTPMADTTVCQDKYTLSQNIPGAAYLWSDGSTGSQLTVDTTGTYSVQVSKDGCVLSDTAHVNIVPIQGINLGDDIDLCTTDAIQITLQVNLPSYISLLWSTGAITPGITVTDTGTYWVQASYLTCENADTIEISKNMVCDCQVAMPTAFTPNSDGKNDLLRPVVEKDCPIGSYNFSVYNRWGQLVYNSFSAEGGGWDGTLNGRPADIGTYMYQLSITVGTKKRNVNLKGDVVLIR